MTTKMKLEPEIRQRLIELFKEYSEEKNIFRQEKDIGIEIKMLRWVLGEYRAYDIETNSWIVKGFKEKVENDLINLCDSMSVDDIIFRDNLEIEEKTIYLDIIKVYADNEEKEEWSEKIFHMMPNSIKNNTQEEIDEIVTILVKEYGESLIINR